MSTRELRRKALTGSLERREFGARGLELRDDGSSTLRLVGTPIVYDTPYKVRDAVGEFVELMRPGVVSDLLKNGCDTRFLFNHQGLPLARTTSGTLKLEDSPKGLRCIAELDARQQLATDLAVAVERGDVTQMSVGMIVGEDTWDARQENRVIHRLRGLDDVSAVTYPASPTTSISTGRGRMTIAELRAELEGVRRRQPQRSSDKLRHFYEHQLRAKYSQADRDRMAKQGLAMPDGSYPIADADDLHKAIGMTGLGNAPTAAIRKHIVACAKALGLSSKVPSHWNVDGTVKARARAGASPIEWIEERRYSAQKHQWLVYRIPKRRSLA